jgi:hypothetical protein
MRASTVTLCLIMATFLGPSLPNAPQAQGTSFIKRYPILVTVKADNIYHELELRYHGGSCGRDKFQYVPAPRVHRSKVGTT